MTVPEIPPGFSFAETDDGFILYRKELDGTCVSIPLSSGDLWGLKANIDLWADRILSHAQPISGSARAIVSHPVGGVEIAMDALAENLLLTLFAPTGERMTFSLPVSVADYLAAEIPSTLRRAADDPLTKQ